MKFAEIADAATCSALDTAWIRAELEPVSEFGARVFERLTPYRPGAEHDAAEHAASVARSAERFTAAQIDAMRDALRVSPDPLAALSRAAMGEVLEDPHLLELMRFLDAAQRVEAIAPGFLNEEHRSAARDLEPGRAGKFGFYLSEKFDTSLAAARERGDRAQAEYDAARGRLAQRAAQALGRDEITGGEFIVMREHAAALPPGVRVVREAPTYVLCELELDDAALDALRRRDQALEEVAIAEGTVRGALSERLRLRVPALEQLAEALGAFDVHLAQARFTQSYGCTPARVLAEPGLAFEDASYLPLREELQAAARAYEPVSIDLRQTAVLTGPNMGGKSVALRTCGFIALLAAFGIPVPARSASCALLEEIAWLGIGAREELGGLLSSFAREVVRLNELLARPSRAALMLIDEFARTTTPQEGRALLVALVRGLERRGRLAFIATHLAGIAKRAGARHFAVRGLRGVPAAPPGGDLQSALAALAKSMDYRVYEVDGNGAAQADAIALAHLLGLDDDLVAEAGMLLRDETEGSWNP